MSHYYYISQSVLYLLIIINYLVLESQLFKNYSVVTN